MYILFLLICLNSIAFNTIWNILAQEASNLHSGPCETKNGTKGHYFPLKDCPTLEDTTTRTYQTNFFLSKAIGCCPDQVEKVNNMDLFPREPICGSILLKRIIGGTKTLIDEFPWTARIKYINENGQQVFLCCGSLISSRWILTAAHCTVGSDLRGARIIGVRLGEWDIETEIDCDIDAFGKRDCAPPHLDVAVDRILPHESFDKIHRYADDIALLRLAYPVNFTDFVKPICLPMEPRLRTDELLNTVVEVTGWGSNTLIKRKAIINVRPLEVCQSSYALWHLKLDNKQLCAGGQIGVDTCRGDSGGPVMAETKNKDYIAYYYVAGIVSFGRNLCGLTQHPAVYTRVGAYVDWIVSKINENL